MRYKFTSTVSGAIRQVLVALLMGVAAHAETTIYVATNGSNAASGTINAPLASLDVARDKLRALTMDYAVVDGATEITIAAWVHPDSKGANDGVVSCTGDYFSLLFSGANNTYPGEFRARGQSLKAPNGSCLAGEWTHMVGVWKSGLIHKLYTNGVEAANNPTPPSGAINTDIWYLGTDRMFNGRHLDGWTKDVYVWSTALTPGQVAALAATPSTVPPGAVMSHTEQVTFESAQSLVLNQNPLNDGATVFLRGGHYPVTSTLFLDGRDSGKAGAPVIYRAYPGEGVILDGSKPIPTIGFTQVQDAPTQARLHPTAQTNLYSATITDPTLVGLLQNLEAELVLDDRMMQQSRFPNLGFSLVTSANTAGEALNGQGSDATPLGADIRIHHSFVFTNWQNELIRERKARLRGYVSAQGIRETLRIHSVDATGLIRLMDGSKNGMNYLTSNPRRPYFDHLLCEIDQPGEWYFDDVDNKLYLWPFDSQLSSSNRLGVWAGPTMFELSCAHVRIENLTLQCLGSGASFVNHHGWDNVTAGCTFRYSPQETVAYNMWSGSRNSGALSCDFYDIDNCSRLYSGRIANDSIEAGGSFFENCHFTQVHSQFPLGKFTALNGAGNRFRHNLVHNHLGHSATIAGVDHLIELNEFFNEGIEISDYGVFYQGASFSSWGHLFLNNFWHHIMTTPGLYERSAIFSDDGDCGEDFIGNVMYKAGSGFKMNAGAGHYAEGNVSLDQITAFYVLNGNPVSFYNSNMGYLDSNPNSGDKNNLIGRGMRDMGIDGWQNTIGSGNWNTHLHTFWTNRYPRLGALANQWKADLTMEKYSDFIDNVIYDNDWSGGIAVPPASTVSGTTTLVNLSSFVDPSRMSFKFKEPLPAYAPDIPFDDIGLYPDDYRTWTPDKNTYRQTIKTRWNAYQSNGGGYGNYNPDTINDRMYYNTGKLIHDMRPPAPTVVDLSRTSYNYDPGTPSSPVHSDWTRLAPDINGDIYWTGTVDSRDRSEITSGINYANRDFIFGSAAAILEHRVRNGIWAVTLNMGDATTARDNMVVKSEDILQDGNVHSAAGSFPYVTFNVGVADGSLSIEFSDAGGSDPHWSVTRFSLSLVTDDSDGDGLPDDWEIHYFGGPTNANPNLDSDLDGLNNGGEYVAGTNPTNAASVFAVTSVNSSPVSGTVIGWDSVSDRLYDVLSTTNLSQSFSLIESNLVHPQNHHTNPPSTDPMRLYQVRVRMP